MTTIYVTKWALTEGIKEVRGCRTDVPTMTRVVSGKGACYDYHVHKPHWHVTYNEAVAQACKMQTKKIASLRKQLARLKTLTFEDSPDG
ncbi:MAG: hypothetical protein V3V96_14330 [Acidiferrobacterales bacterium]